MRTEVLTLNRVKLKKKFWDTLNFVSGREVKNSQSSIIFFFSSEQQA